MLARNKGDKDYSKSEKQPETVQLGSLPVVTQ